MSKWPANTLAQHQTQNMKYIAKENFRTRTQLSKEPKHGGAECCVMSHPVKALGLKGMTTGVVKLPPAPGSTPIYRLCEQRKKKKKKGCCFTCATHSRVGV